MLRKTSFKLYNSFRQKLQGETRRRHIFTKMNTESLYMCNFVKVSEMTYEYDPQTSGFLRLKNYFININFLKKLLQHQHQLLKKIIATQQNAFSSASTQTSVYCRKAAEMYSIGLQIKISRHIAQAPC